MSLEYTVVELVYKFDEKSTASVKLTDKVRFKKFYVHKHVYMDTNTDHFIPLALRVRGKICSSTTML